MYFRRGSYCRPTSYDKAKTVYDYPLNVKDKRLYGHPTIKPLHIVRNLIENSSTAGNLILDPFMGSGTTAVACKELNRNYIGFEINKEHHEASQKRLALTATKRGNNEQIIDTR